ncbi:MAG: RnfABCDGE type electron transport complex subunit D, partial [Gammaproteobacteria bacterium]|nr:RnfABCDGE type electron transport complex subunit D [Gammaproteobacteria bacterium]
PLHQLQNGALLIFAFFMISDPKTTPNSAAARLVYGALVACIAYTIQFVFYTPNGPIIALILAAPLVPLFDLAMNGRIYRWQQQQGVS